MQETQSSSNFFSHFSVIRSQDQVTQNETKSFQNNKYYSNKSRKCLISVFYPWLRKINNLVVWGILIASENIGTLLIRKKSNNKNEKRLFSCGVVLTVSQAVWLSSLCMQHHKPCLHQQPPTANRRPPTQDLPPVHRSTNKETKTPRRFWRGGEELNTISCFCWNCRSRLAGSVISLHTVVPVKLQFIKSETRHQKDK